MGFFSNLTKEETKLLESISTVHNYSKEYLLSYEKEQSTHILFLLDGFAKAYKIDKNSNEIFLFHIYKDSVISDLSNVHNNLITSFSNISLLEDSKILKIEYKKFMELFVYSGILCQEYTNQLILRSNQLQMLLNREFIFDSVQKVAMMLDHDLEMFNKLKRSDISSILHIQPETLSRVLGKLKRDEIIDSSLGNIVVLNKTKLTNIYEE